MALYEIGKAGSPYQNLGDIIWNSLQPGDVVEIHWKPEAYNERLLLNPQGTEENPIVIRGIPGPNGELPVLDANNATTPEQFSNFNATWRQNLGGSIFVGPPNGYPDDSEVPQHIVIDGFEITGTGQGNTFTTTTGSVEDYVGGAGVYVKGAVGLTIQNNYIHHNGMGVFSNSNHDYEITEGLIIQNNVFDQNGVDGSYLRHHVYTEGVNTTVDGNIFKEKIAGDQGSLLKMRDVGITVTNNEFGNSPGHVIDLSDVQADAMRVLGLGQSEEFFHNNVIAGNSIDISSGYGNIYIGGDSLGKETGAGVGSETYRKSVDFTDNTLSYASDRSDIWRIGILRAPSHEQTFNLEGNIFVVGAATEGSTPTNFGLLSDSGNLNIGDENFITSIITQWSDNAGQDGVINGWENLTLLALGEFPEQNILEGTDEAETIEGTVNSDIIYGFGEKDYIHGFDGDDIIYGGDGDDHIYGQEGNDVLIGGSGDDRISGHEGNDTIEGNDGEDVLYGYQGDDIIYGGDGNDYLYGDDKRGESDYLNGGADTLHGGEGNDRIIGGVGDDTLYGDAGSDTLYGSDGNDTLVGGNGRDYLNGESGADTFFLDLESVDRIRDFDQAEGDMINVADLLDGYDSSSNDINDFLDIVIRSTNRTDIRINEDGVGGDFQYVGIVYGDLTGETVESLVSNGVLIVE